MYKKLVLIFVFLLPLLLPWSFILPISAVSASPLQEIIQDITDDDNRLAEAIRHHFGFSTHAYDIAALRRDNMGYGEISIAHGLSYLSGRSVHHIMAMRSEHMGWGRIAKELGVKVSDAVHHSKRTLHRANVDRDFNLDDIFNNDDQHHQGKGHPSKDNDNDQHRDADNNNPKDRHDHENGKGNGKNK